MNGETQQPIVHTPGPWTCSIWSFNPGKGKPATIYAGDEGMEEIAICSFDRDPDDPASIEANARLIAAAPELLAAASDVCGSWERHGDVSSLLFIALREAIEKATKGV